jgi:hypothetical protein
MEYEAQENSAYLPWLDSLPRLHFSAVSMTDFCYECLPPLVFNLSRAERLKFDNFVQVLKNVDLVSDAVKSNEEVLKWAFNSVYTRTYCEKEGQYEGDVALVPYADMLNHAAVPETELYFDDEGNCMVYTLVDVPANSPLRISYGDPTNPSFLFARYGKSNTILYVLFVSALVYIFDSLTIYHCAFSGFMDESSPAGFCKMMDIPKSEENVAMGMDPTKMLFYHETGDMSQEVLDVVLYAKVLSDKKYTQDAGDVKRQFYEAHMSGDEQTKAQIHEMYRYEVMNEILNHCDTFLELLGRLEEKGYSKSFDEHPRLPVILQHNELVKQTFLKVKANLEPLMEQYENGGGGVEWYSDDSWGEEYVQEDEYYQYGDEGYTEEYV